MWSMAVSHRWCFRCVGREAKAFYYQIIDLYTKGKMRKSITVSRIRAILCFSFLKSPVLCLRGSRTAGSRNMSILEETIEFSHMFVKAIKQTH